MSHRTAGRLAVLLVLVLTPLCIAGGWAAAHYREAFIGFALGLALKSSRDEAATYIMRIARRGE